MVAIAAHLLQLITLVVSIALGSHADVFVVALVGVIVVQHLEAIRVTDDTPLEVVQVHAAIHQTSADAQLRIGIAIHHLTALVRLNMVVHQVIPMLVGIASGTRSCTTPCKRTVDGVIDINGDKF